ncbi:MAG: GNAT family N-acetyltransferase, partial [Candidatus Dormiibacterota bacterium]
MTEAPVLWSLRPITKAEFEWGYALHRETLREYVEPMWGWDEVVQQRLFANSFDLDGRKVIEVDGEPVGVLQVDERPDELFLVLIELRPDWQNRGLGTAILRSLLGRAEGLQRPLTLHVLREPAGGRPLCTPRDARHRERSGAARAGQRSAPPRLM